MRLTKKTKNGYFHKLFGDNPIYTREQMISDLDDIVQKLGQLEDIEEELGIDFNLFIKALLHGIYVKTDEGIKDYTNCSGWLWKLGQNDDYVDTQRPSEYYFAVIFGRVYHYYFKDYGKTWALTKEELD